MLGKVRIIKMKSKLRVYQNYSRKIKWLLTAAGLWPDYSSTLKRLISTLSLLSSFTIMVMVINFCIENKSNIMVLVQGLGPAVSFASVFVKVSVFLMHQDDLSYLNDFLTPRYLVDLEIREDQEDLLNRISTFTYFFHVHSTSTGIAVLLYSIAPLLVFMIYGKYIRVTPSKFPFYYEPGGVVYWSIYCFEVMCEFFLWTVTSGVDCVFGLYSLQICGEFRILTKRLQNLKINLDYRTNLVDCIRRHYLLIQSKKRLESTFGILAIWLAISGSFVLCSLIFQVTKAAKNHASIAQTILLCCYLVPKFLQIFMYAWYGNLITDESGRCLNSLYNSDWPESCNVRLKNDILIFLTQKPLVLVAKGCMFIQLNMFVKIVNTSVSYFFLLQTISEEQ